METLDYDAKISAEQADEYFIRVKESLREAQARPYRHFIDRLRRHLDPKHIKELSECFGALLPLTHQGVVLNGQTEEATLPNIVEILQTIAEFESNYRNTGVSLIGTPDSVKRAQRRARRPFSS